MKTYLDIVRRVLDQGELKPSRTGIWTRSLFNVNYQIDLTQGFPLLTTKEVSWKNIVIENLWFLSGAKDVGFLHKHGCHFWDPWVKDTGEVPSAYGFFWRHYPDGSEGGFDQIKALIDCLKTDPFSRRMIVSAFNPPSAHQSTLPPCHSFWQLLVTQCDDGKRRLNLHLTQRSCDIAVGLPYNIAGYALILCLMSKIAHLEPGYFAHSITDAHIYTSSPDQSDHSCDHIPALKEQLERKPLPLAKLQIAPSIRCLSDIEALFTMSTHCILERISLSEYRHHPKLAFAVAV